MKIMINILIGIMFIVTVSAMANADSPVGLVDFEMNGTVGVWGVDNYNDFSLGIMGHENGANHTLIVTGMEDSRLTLGAMNGVDTAPRVAMVGPLDSEEPETQGWVVVDYGSSRYDLPNAKFKIRKTTPGGNVDMMVVDEDGVAFPGDVYVDGNIYVSGATVVRSADSDAKRISKLEHDLEYAYELIEALVARLETLEGGYTD